MNSKICALIILLILAAIEIIYLSKSPLGYGFPGSIDFIQYWSAFQLFDQGLNPYDSKLMLELEKNLGFTSNLPIMMWLPPWALLILKPFMLFDFKIGFLSFLIFNLTLLLLSSYLLQLIFSSEKKFTLTTCLLGLLFFPAWDCINYGQISILLLFASSVGLYFILKYNKNSADEIFAGLTIPILSLKPHLFILSGLAAIFWGIQNKKYKFIGTAIFSMLALAIFTDFYHKNVIALWIETLINNGAAGSIKTTEWAPATLGTWLRVLLGKEKTYLMWAPTILGVILIITCFLKKSSDLIDHKKTVALLISASLLLSPYAWYYDQSLLLICQVYLFYAGGINKIIAIQAGYLLLKIVPDVHQQHFAIMLLLWIIAVYFSTCSTSSSESSGEKSSAA